MKTHLVAALVLSAGLAFPVVGAPPAPTEKSVAVAALPGTVPGKCAKAFIEMVNTPEPDSVRAFETAYGSTKRHAAVSIDERVPRIKTLHGEWGTCTLSRVSASSDTGITLIVKTEKLGPLELDFQFNPKEAGKLDSIVIETYQESAALTPELRASTIEGAITALNEGYVFPEIARRMGESVQAKLAAGEYNSISDERALARRLTEELRAISKDKHLGVNISPASSASEPMHGPSAQEMEHENYAFRKVERLDDNIGYIRFDLFLEEEEAKKTASAALAFLAHSDAVIFDLRYNGGGSPEMIRYITSYLFDEPTHLNSMVDREGKTVEEYWTLKDIPGQRFPKDLPVYVLTSSRTFSGAEEFSYNLKNLKRATIVGETTGGGAHPVRGERINERFVIRVPYVRANNPISKTNWEGTGVEPDIKTSADSALERAIEEAKSAVSKKAGK